MTSDPDAGSSEDEGSSEQFSRDAELVYLGVPRGLFHATVDCSAGVRTRPTGLD